MKKSKKFLRKIRPFFPRFAIFLKSLEMGFSRRSFLRKSGFMRSVVEGSAVTEAGDPLPWFNYAVIDIIKNRLPSDAVVFEYGAGSSTEFFSDLVGKVYSVESDRSWFDRLKKSNMRNCELYFASPDQREEYVKSISRPNEKFDLVLVDGLHRIDCLKQSVEFCSDSGVIVVDDLNDKEFWQVVEKFKDKGFRSLAFHGLKPGSPRRLTTTIIYRDSNCLSI